jgi:hypothetical protein
MSPMYNPFRLRVAEQFESETSFLRLFEPGMLRVLKGRPFLQQPLVVRSSPGSGKSSLMRLFSAPALVELHRMRDKEDFRALFEKLRGMGVVASEGPFVFGILLSAAHNYSALDDLSLGEAQRLRLFFGLLNARVVLAGLRSVIDSRKLGFPGGLRRLQLRPSSLVQGTSRLVLPADGVEVFDWARELEANACDAIDSLGPIGHLPGLGDDTLWSIQLLRADSLLCDGEPVAKQVLVMIDDIHCLAEAQRAALMRTLGEARMAGIWLAERFQALDAEELLGDGAIEGRDRAVVNIDAYWRDSRNHFVHCASHIADIRARVSSDIELSSFGECLEEVYSEELLERAKDAVRVVRERVSTLVSKNPQFQEWYAEYEIAEGSPIEIAVAWRMLEILIRRELGRKQMSFDFQVPDNQLKEKEKSSVKEAARLFITREFDLPCYFGMSALSCASSSNIEQLLSIAGDQFDEVVAQSLVRQNRILDVDRQDRLLKSAAQRLYEEIQQRVRFGREVKRFLASMSDFARDQTYRETAPYAPGVTGIGITMEERELLRGKNPLLQKNEHYRLLAETLASAIAHNLLEVRLDHRCKGRDWMVMYLNRLLCVRASLPLSYGGWRERSLKELAEWAHSRHGQQPTFRWNTTREHG